MDSSDWIALCLALLVLLNVFYVGMKFGDWRFRRKLLRDIYDNRSVPKTQEDYIPMPVGEFAEEDGWVYLGPSTTDGLDLDDGWDFLDPSTMHGSDPDDDDNNGMN